MAREGSFKSQFIKRLQREYPRAIITKNDANQLQGIPDILFLLETFWAVFEAKDNVDSPYRPNQEYYLDLMNNMSFARVVYPEIEEEVIRELQRAYRTSR